MSDNAVRFTVEFDSQVWADMSPEARSQWVDTVTDLINQEAYVSAIETEPRG